MSAVITPARFQALTQAEVIENLSRDFRRIYGENIELEPNTPDGQVVGICSQMTSDHNEMIRTLFASLFPSQAEGVFLDYNLDLIGVRRISGRAASVNLNIEFEGERDIAQGTFIVRIQGVDFLNETDIKTEGEYAFTAMESGSMQFSDADTVSISTSVAGVSATFVSTSATGADYESDTDFRQRWIDLVDTRDRSAPHIEGVLKQIEGVEDARVYETDSEPFAGIPANSIYAVLKPGYFDKDKILDALIRMKTPGIRSFFTSQDPEQSKVFGNGGNITVGFDLAEYVKLENFSFRYGSKARTSSEIGADVIFELLKTMRFRIGESVFASDVDNFVLAAMPEWFAFAGNSINGDNYIAGRIGVIYEF